MFGNTDLETQDDGTDCLKRGPLGIDARPQSRIPLHSWRPPLADDRAAILLESPLSFLRLGSFDPMSRGHVLGGVRTLRLSACWISFFTGLALFVRGSCCTTWGSRCRYAAASSRRADPQHAYARQLLAAVPGRGRFGH